MYRPTHHELDRPRRADLAGVWTSLINGEEVISECFFTDTRCGLVLAPARNSQAGARTGLVTEGQRIVVEQVLRGTCQSAIAIELDVAPSTVALRAKKGLARLGVRTRPLQAHPLLMLAACVASGAAPTPYATEEPGGEQKRVIAMPRPELCLSHTMPRAQLETVALLVEGRTYANIAQRRSTATRTTANQLATAFQTLRVSGRLQLIHRLFALSGWLPHPPGLAMLNGHRR